MSEIYTSKFDHFTYTYFIRIAEKIELIADPITEM